jgi:protein SCO1/2
MTPTDLNRAAAGCAADGATPWRRFFLGADLPIFLFAAVAIYEAALGAILFGPQDAGWLGDFSREFKIRCFNYDPRTGGMEWAAVGMMLLEPIFVVAVAAVLWRRALGRQRWAGSWRAALAGVGIATSAIGSVVALGAASAGGEIVPPFPGERIRTRLIAPDFHLTDQAGQPCALADLRGRVVLVTGVYALCSTTCPPLLIETRQLLDSLPAAERARVTVVAMSLNPEYDTRDVMTAVAAGYGFTHPEFRYLNGAPAAMHEVLDRWQFARVKNAQTGVIEHANLFLLVDADGHIAYRFNLNPRHQAWLREAILALAAEAPGRESQ